MFTKTLFGTKISEKITQHEDNNLFKISSDNTISPTQVTGPYKAEWSTHGSGPRS